MDWRTLRAIYTDIIYPSQFETEMGATFSAVGLLMVRMNDHISMDQCTAELMNIFDVAKSMMRY
jgi:hypothetical protein